jgi:hypothetical protein
MESRPFIVTALAAAIFFSTLTPVSGAGKPEDDLAAAVKAFLSESTTTDWQGVEKMPNIRWAPLPPTTLQKCLPDGGCFTRQGAAVIADRKLVAVATGARTIVSNVYLRNVTAPFGEAAVVAALKGAGFSADLARCPVKPGVGGTNWYKLAGSGLKPGFLSIQSLCNGKPCEGFVIHSTQDLPTLQPSQLQLYTEQCSVPPSERKPVSTRLPHEQIADTVAALIPAAGAALPDWKAVAGMVPGIQWFPGPKKVDLSFKNDPNPLSQTGQVAFSGRRMSVLASGSQTEVKTIYLEEGGMHPRGEHMLGTLYTLGFGVKLARCGPIYTESTNNWYSIANAKSRPVMLRQSIRYEGNQVQDAYELRLDGTLPARDARDRDPGVNGCR